MVNDSNNPSIAYRPGEHIPALDGLRGCAVLLVLCYDCLKITAATGPFGLIVRKICASGWIGVDLFFVLSGFLITGILLDTAGKQGYWKSFLWRRSLRIFPLYYTTLATIFFVIPVVTIGIAPEKWQTVWQAVREQQLWYWCYGQNFLFAWQGVWPADRILNHFWSLAVEEQFYVIWPVVILWFRKGRLLPLIAGLCLAALVLRIALFQFHYSPVTGYVLTLARMDSLCYGALVAWLMRSSYGIKMLQYAPWLLIMMLLLTVGIDAVWPVLKSESVGAITIGHTLVGLLFASLIGCLIQWPDKHWGSQLFCLKPLVSLGKYSYAIYVFHRFIYYGWLELATANQWDWFSGWLLFVVTVLSSWGAAVLSWHLLESRFLQWKDYIPRPSAVTLPAHTRTCSATSMV